MATVPDVPSVFKQPLTERTQMTFWWNAPTSDGGSPITSYVLCNATPPISRTYSADTQSAFITGLITNTAYSFQVAASNSVGLGSYAAFNRVTTGIRPIPVQTISVTPTKTTSNALVNWTSNTSNNTFNLTGNVIAARAFDISGTAYEASNLKPSFPASATSGFLQNLGPFSYRIFAQPTNSVGYGPLQISTIVDNIPGSAIFQTYGALSNSMLQFGIPASNSIFSATTPFTLEWWQYLTDLPAGSQPSAYSCTTNPNTSIDDSFSVRFVSSIGAGVSNVNYQIRYRAMDNIGVVSFEQSSAVAQSNIVNRWQHVALVGTVSNGPPLVTRMRLYVGGQYIFETSSNYNLGTLLQMQLGAPIGTLFNNTLFGFNGAITSFRMTKDAALYGGASLVRPTPPLFNALSGSTEALLPFWFANDFSDRSPNSNATNNFLSTVSWLKIFPGSPDLSGSIVFNPNGSATYLDVNLNTTQPMSSNTNWTYEFYAYLNSFNQTTIGTAPRFFSMSTQTGNPQPEERLAWYLNYSNLNYYHTYITYNGTSVRTTQGSLIGSGILEEGWHHFAMVGSNVGTSNFINTYIDGAFIDQIAIGSNQATYNYNSPISKFFIGHAVNTASSDTSKCLRGKITSFHFQMNSAQYTTYAFTPPAVPITSNINTQLLLTSSSPFTFTRDSSSSPVKTVTNFGTTFSQNLPGGYAIYSTTDGGLTASNSTSYTASNINVTTAGTLGLVQMEMLLQTIPPGNPPPINIAVQVYRIRSGNTTNIPTNALTALPPANILRFWTARLNGPLSVQSGDTLALMHSNMANAVYQTGAASMGPPSVVPTVRFITIKPEITG